MQHHQLAQLREKLQIWVAKAKRSKSAHDRLTCASVVKQTRGLIDTLGARGVLKMALVVKKELYDEAGEYPHRNITLSYFFHDLDDESIYVLLDAYLGSGDSYISKSIIIVPLKQPLPTSLKNNIISWSIN